MTLFRVGVTGNLVGNERMTEFHGAKLALISGDHVLTLLRDDIATIPFPDMWDFPGGGREGDETPQDCVLRELHEEFGLRLEPHDLVYQNSRAGVLRGQPKIWFFGAVLNGLEPSQIKFGNEGQRWELMLIETYLAHPKAVSHLKDGLDEFLAFLEQSEA